MGRMAKEAHVRNKLPVITEIQRITQTNEVDARILKLKLRRARKTQGAIIDPGVCGLMGHMNPAAVPGKERELLDEVRLANGTAMSTFLDALHEAGLAESTIQRHMENVSVFLNLYLEWRGPYTYAEGVGEINYFLGDFFITVCAWSTPTTIKNMVTTLRRFYKTLTASGLTDQDDLAFVEKTIRKMMPEWLEICAEYNDPKQGNPYIIRYLGYDPGPPVL